MAYSISNLKDDLEGVIGAASLDSIKNLTPLINRASRHVLAEIDPAETKRTAALASGIFDDVYDYAAPADLKGKKVIDIRPQVSRGKKDAFNQVFTKEFDRRKLLETFQVNDTDYVKTIRLSASAPVAAKVLHDMDALAANGSWTASGDASGLAVDTITKVSGAAALSFDLAANGTQGVLTNSTFTQVDLTDEDEAGSLFLWLYVPSTAFFTSLELRWGNDASNYWARTVTTPHDGNALKQYWNLFRFDWNGATETGTVNPAQIDYLRVAVNYSSTTAVSNLRIDKIMAALPIPFELVYYSKYIFRSSAGTWKESMDTDSDLINLDTDSYNIFLYQLGLIALEQVKGDNPSPAMTWLTGELYGTAQKRGLYAIYNETNPSEVEVPQTTYYEETR